VGVSAWQDFRKEILDAGARFVPAPMETRRDTSRAGMMNDDARDDS
jgi:hypothetical protein